MKSGVRGVRKMAPSSWRRLRLGSTAVQWKQTSGSGYGIRGLKRARDGEATTKYIHGLRPKMAIASTPQPKLTTPNGPSGMRQDRRD